MEYAVGVILGIGIGIFGTFVGLERDRALYPTALVVIASYYCLFAVLGGSNSALAQEMLAAVVFIVIAAVGFRTNLWLVAAGIAGHGIFDALHGYVIHNPGLPVWWPAFCGTIDIVIAAYLVIRLFQQKIPSRH